MGYMSVGKPVLRIVARVGGVQRPELVSGLDHVSVGGTGLVFRISDYGKDVTARPECVVSPNAEDAEFVAVTPEELGFTRNPTVEQLFDEEGLLKHGLGLCRPDDAHGLRKAYMDQPDGEWIPVAMKPIRNSRGDWHVFSLGRKGVWLWLRADCNAFPRASWFIRDRVFFRRRKAQR